MGNTCCKKKKPAGKPRLRAPPPGQYQKVEDQYKITEEGGPIPSTMTGAESAVDQFALHADVETGRASIDPVILQIIQEMNLADKLDAVVERLRNYQPTTLKKISDDKDPYSLFFEVFTDEAKDKFHTTFMTSSSNLSPLAFKLINSLIPEEQELAISSNYERFITIFRGKIEDVFYIMNYALYKQVMLFNKKDLLFMKAFKLLADGSVVEITASITHPDFPEKKGIDRIKIIENVVHYRRTADGGSEIVSLNSLYPRVGVGFTMLKPLFSKSYRAYQKALSEYLTTASTDEKALEADFVNFRKPDDFGI